MGHASAQGGKQSRVLSGAGDDLSVLDYVMVSKGVPQLGKAYEGVADLLGMLDVQALWAIVAPGDAGEPVQVVAGDIEFRRGWLQRGQLTQLLLNHTSSVLGNGVLEGLHLVPKAAWALTRSDNIHA